MGKAFEKQTKTIKDQGKKQIDALADLNPKEIEPSETRPNKYNDYFLDEIAKIRKSCKPVDFNDSIYDFKNSSIPSVSFIKFKDPLHVFKNIHDGYLPLEDVEREKIELKGYLGRIKQGAPKNRSEQEKKTINNIDNLYNLREEVVQMFNDYATNMSRNFFDLKQGTGFKILTPTQMFQRLLIALAQIKQVITQKVY